MKFDRQLRPVTETSWVVSYGGKQFQDGGRPPFWKSIYRHISAKNHLISMKFCTQQQILNWMNVTWSKIKKLHWTDSRVRQNVFLVSIIIIIHFIPYTQVAQYMKSRDHYKFHRIPLLVCVFGWTGESRGCWIHWDTLVPEFGGSATEVPVASTLVPTVETVRMEYLVDVLARRGSHVMLVGDGGSAKSLVVRRYLSQKNTDAHLSRTVVFSSATTSATLQVSFFYLLHSQRDRDASSHWRSLNVIPNDILE